MKILKETLSKNKNKIELLGNDCCKNILVIGVFHGDEPQGEYLINKYLKENDSNLMFIPCLNPDGKNLKTRQNANNVDLNRNFPTKNWINCLFSLFGFINRSKLFFQKFFVHWILTVNLFSIL